MTWQPPSHPPAPHSLWELGVVERGLQDAGREHWGHRRTLQLVSPCPAPTHSITQHHGTLGLVPIPDPPCSPPGADSAHPSGSCWAGSRRSVPGEAAATCKERQQCWAAQHEGHGSAIPLHSWGTGQALLASLCPSAYSLWAASRHGDSGHRWHHAGPPCPPG